MFFELNVVNPSSLYFLCKSKPTIICGVILYKEMCNSRTSLRGVPLLVIICEICSALATFKLGHRISQSSTSSVSFVIFGCVEVHIVHPYSGVVPATCSLSHSGKETLSNNLKALTCSCSSILLNLCISLLGISCYSGDIIHRLCGHLSAVVVNCPKAKD